MHNCRMVLATLALSQSPAFVQRMAVRAGSARFATDDQSFVFRVHPWNLWLAYPTDAVSEINALLPPGLSLARHAVYEVGAVQARPRLEST